MFRFAGGGEAPKNLSGRLVAATWWLFGFIVIASYTANLAAFLTVSRLDSSITSLDDLSKQYKFQYAPAVGTATMTYFQRMADIESKFYEYAFNRPFQKYPKNSFKLLSKLVQPGGISIIQYHHHSIHLDITMLIEPEPFGGSSAKLKCSTSHFILGENPRYIST